MASAHKTEGIKQHDLDPQSHHLLLAEFQCRLWHARARVIGIYAKVQDRVYLASAHLQAACLSHAFIPLMGHAQVSNMYLP